MIWDAWRCFYQALTLFAHYPSLTASVQQTTLIVLDRLCAQMQTWAENSPENFGHRNALLAAESAALRGDASEAMTAYERAIAEAAEHGFIQIEALANECYARFWLRRGNENVAEIYLRVAERSYAQWGAAAKVESLQTRYPNLLGPMPSDPLDPHALDLTTVMRASQVISGEVEPHRFAREASAHRAGKRGCPEGVPSAGARGPAPSSKPKGRPRKGR